MSLPGPRDIRQELADVVDGNRFPSLKAYFNNTNQQIFGTDAEIHIIHDGQTSDGPSSNWLGIMENALRECDMRFNIIAEEKDVVEDNQSRLQNQVHALKEEGQSLLTELQERSREYLDLQNNHARLNEAYVTQKTRANTLDDMIKRGAVGNSGGSGDSNTAMPHPEKFSGDETNSTKRTQTFRTWQNQIQARWI